MQKRDSLELSAKWERDHPGETCSHPELEKEYDLGGATGDWCCTQCGYCKNRSDWNRD